MPSEYKPPDYKPLPECKPREYKPPKMYLRTSISPGLIFGILRYRCIMDFYVWVAKYRKGSGLNSRYFYFYAHLCYRLFLKRVSELHSVEKRLLFPENEVHLENNNFNNVKTYHGGTFWDDTKIGYRFWFSANY